MMEELKGQWLIVHGVFTPGGDPCWYCSNCGKDEHLFGIECPENQHNICKNCRSHNEYNYKS
jgi:hypothetical protein